MPLKESKVIDLNSDSDFGVGHLLRDIIFALFQIVGKTPVLNKLLTNFNK